MESKNEVKKDNSIVYIIIIAILLTIIFSGIAWNAGRNYSRYEDSKYADKKEEKNNSKTEDVTKDDKEEDNKVDEKEEDNKVEQKEENNHVSLEFVDFVEMDETKEKEININNKKITIKMVDKEGLYNYLYINNKLFGEWSPNHPGGYEYRVITGADNKEYLFFRIDSENGSGGSIINDNGVEIASVTSDPTDIDCSSYSDEDDLVYIDTNDNVYYYKYIEGSRTDDWEAKLELVKLIINNNKVTEEKQDKIISASMGQCA